jgi:hypothetical protein
MITAHAAPVKQIIQLDRGRKLCAAPLPPVRDIFRRRQPIF